MAIIKFANGTQVNFNGNPTPQDVEEVANKLGINKSSEQSPISPAPEQPGFLKSLAQGIAKPFLKTIAAPFAAVKAGVQLASGNKEGAAQTVNNPVDFGYLGKVTPVGGKVDTTAPMGKQLGQFAKDVTGTGVEIGSWFIPVSKAAEGVKTIGTGAKILKSAGQGVKIGAGSGAMMGAGQALQEDQNVIGGAFKGGLGGAAFGGVLGAAGAGIGKVLQPAKVDLANFIGKALKPSYAGKTTVEAQSRFMDESIKAFETIADNKNILQFSDSNGNVINRLPESRADLSKAIQDIKSYIFKEYDSLSKKAGEAGATFNIKPIIGDLEKITTDINYAPEIRRYAQKSIDNLSELQGASPAVVQSRIQYLNESLPNFLSNKMDKAQSRIDLSIAGKLNQSLDELITNITGNSYKGLRQQYSYLKTIEKDVAKEVAKELRANNKTLIDYTDIFTGGDILAGVVDPTSLIRGAAGRGIKEAYKYLNDPNRYVKKIFEVIEKQKSKQPKNIILKPAPVTQNNRLLAAPKGQPSVYPTPLITPVPASQMLPKEINAPIYERGRGLAPENRQIEDKAYQKISKEKTKILESYKKRHGIVVNADNFRPYFTAEGYAGHNAEAVQEPVSYLAKQAFAENLKNPGDFAILYAGGSGSGKTSALKNVNSIQGLVDDSSVILDSNLSSYSSAIKKIGQAQDAGKKVPIVYVYRPPIESFEKGVVKRMLTNKQEMGRLVPTKVVAGNHIDSWKVAKRLYEEGHNVYFIDNSLGAKNAKISSFEELNNKIKYPSHSSLKNEMDQIVKQLYDGKQISKEQYEGYIE